MSSTIETKLNDALKEAMRQKDQRVLSVIRQVKTKMTERRTAPDFSGEVNDALWVEVIGSYVKSLKKAQDEFAKGGEKAKAQIEELDFEIRYLEPYLPKMKSEDEVRAIVKDTIAALGVTGKQKIGQVMGAVMKAHKGEVDAALVKRIAEELLT